MKNLTNKLVKRLIKKKLTISLAESCTGGMLSSTITSISGSSKIFNLGIVTYSNKSKIDILKVPKKIIKKYGSVSNECCLSMIKNLSKISKANIFVSITGIAGPNGGTKLIVQKNLFTNKGRISIQKAATNKVLKILLDLK